MKISDLKQPYREIAEADYLEQNIKIKTVNDNAILEDFRWSVTCAGHDYYVYLDEGIYPYISDKIRKDYADVFAKLKTQPEWIPVKGEMVEVSCHDMEWDKREFIADLGAGYTRNRYAAWSCLSVAGRVIPCLYDSIRRIEPVTELTHKQIKAAMGIKGNIKIVE
jgi:hypothetical protein